MLNKFHMIAQSILEQVISLTLVVDPLTALHIIVQPYLPGGTFHMSI